MKHIQTERSAKYDAFMGEYFSQDKEIHDAMRHILQLMDDKIYTSADAACDKLLEKCFVPEEQAADSVEASASVCRAAFKCGKMDLVNSRLQKCASEHYEDYAALRKEVRGY